jgi:hypothetical protein
MRYKTRDKAGTKMIVLGISLRGLIASWLKVELASNPVKPK